ncbi:MAG: hypothetical protein JWL68_83 [Actinomycetia bacterium]|nr:hypothetical protein [Actinomycetes bacterium]
MFTATGPRTLRWYAGAARIASGRYRLAALFPIYSHSGQSGVMTDLSSRTAYRGTYSSPPSRSGQRPWFATASAAAAAACGSR